MIAPTLGVGRRFADLCLDSMLGETGGGDDVINSPTAVSVEATATPGPPGVRTRAVTAKSTSQVDPLALEPAIEVGTLLDEETGLASVAPPVLDVDFMMGDIEVTANNDMTLAPCRPRTQLGEPRVHRFEEFELFDLLGSIDLTGMNVGGNHGDRPEGGCEVDLDPTPEAIENGITGGLLLARHWFTRQNRHPGTTQLRGRGVRHVIPGKQG